MRVDDGCRSKTSEVIEDIVFMGMGLVLLINLIFFSLTTQVHAVFSAVIGTFLFILGVIGLLVDTKIEEKRIKKPVWWQLNLPFVLGLLFIYSGTFFTSDRYGIPSKYSIILVSIGVFLCILTISYDVFRRYKLYLRKNE